MQRRIKQEPLPTDSSLGIILTKDFARKNEPQKPYILPACVPETEEPFEICRYPKFYVHPNTDNCYQPEELRWYYRLRNKNIANDFTESRDKIWGVDSGIPARILPNFARQNQPQTDLQTEHPDISSIPKNQRLACNLSAMYPRGSYHEMQREELWRIKRKNSGASTNRFEGNTRINITFTADEEATDEISEVSANAPANIDESIYFKSTLVQPKWTENNTEEGAVEKSAYVHEAVNLEESRIFIRTELAEKCVDPFKHALRNAQLTDLQFMDLLKTDVSCDLVGSAPTVAVKRKIQFKGTDLTIIECVGHGTYGRVFKAKWSKNGSTYAVKKVMPANVWEYYILKEVHSRVVENLSGYMKADMAIIANDGSLLFSQYSQYGTLLDVCNRYFSSTKSNINEPIVFILAYQMLDLVDRLHKADILHLDLKPDNFLVMRPMSTNHRELFIQLIDFGNAVDLRQYPPMTQFNGVMATKYFVCLEMLEKKPWIFQPDCFCLAATIHSVLFGRYLDVKKVVENYRADIKIPRYFNAVWSRFFGDLIGIPEGSGSPNLLSLKESFEIIISQVKDLKRVVSKFNQHIV